MSVAAASCARVRASVVGSTPQVVRPPDGAVVLASSDFCPNAMLRIGDRILTMQGHPEMNVPTVDRLLDMRRDRVGDHLVIYGETMAFHSQAEGEGLGYFRGRYTAISRS